MLNWILDKAKNNSELSLVFEEMEQNDNTTTPKACFLGFYQVLVMR